MSLIRLIVKTTIWSLRTSLKLALFAAEAPFWIGHLGRHLVSTSVDAGRAVPRLGAGSLRCPAGHSVPTENVICTCTSCEFTYRGSPLRCPNKECLAPSAAFVDCPICGLSTPSPYRLGRP